ncbi:SGNH/GDSL hydrolase family protein [Flagellimonas sp. HMM57]|uniref:SGNH/GDSL hydrolase family protein n=1 Tax=unclassified Flagellimonas TaxID=2644544 RepID=UPI0013D3CF3F|nr:MULTISPECIES: SGNH/GDSL hydrolase family protein [unclassified Flagellimonas]UII75970.1 SGNH/GDSL hydrolase family protein [Flagellimonas sp. HMM57]
MIAQDWPNLNKYRKANQALKADSILENSVVFMGNSITEGWSVAHPDFFDGKPYINRGISGQTTPQMLLRFRQDVIDLHPKIVIILAGTNDIAGNTGPIGLEQIRDNILSMVELAKANGIYPIVCSVLPAFDYGWRPGKEPNIKIPKLNSLLKKMALAQNIHYVDYFSAMADDRNGLPKDLAEDGVHPTKKGYLIMAGLVDGILIKTLKDLK